MFKRGVISLSTENANNIINTNCRGNIEINWNLYVQRTIKKQDQLYSYNTIQRQTDTYTGLAADKLSETNLATQLPDI